MTGREPVRVGAVIVDVGPDQHKALLHAERKVRTYGKVLLGLAGLLCLSVCGNLVCSALSILVFKESRDRDATLAPHHHQWCHPTRRRPRPWAPAHPMRAPASVPSA